MSKVYQFRKKKKINEQKYICFNETGCVFVLSAYKLTIPRHLQ